MMIAWPAVTASHRKQGPHHCRPRNWTLPRQEYPCKKSTTRARTTAPARAARCYCRPRGRDLCVHGAESSRVFLLNLKISLDARRIVTHAKCNCESESDITSPCSEARPISGRESATCAVTGQRARASSFSKSESRTSPREDSLPMQQVINHKTARGSRSKERQLPAERARLAQKKRRNAGSAGGTAEQGASREPTRCGSQEGKAWRHKFRR